MTIREAILAEIEPYEVSDDSVEKGLIDACRHTGQGADIDSDYTFEEHDVVLIAAMYCLGRLCVLTSENVGGVSQSYNVTEVEKRIKSLASQAGVSPNLVLSDDSDARVTYMPIW